MRFCCPQTFLSPRFHHRMVLCVKTQPFWYGDELRIPTKLISANSGIDMFLV